MAGILLLSFDSVAIVIVIVYVRLFIYLSIFLSVIHSFIRSFSEVRLFDYISIIAI